MDINTTHNNGSLEVDTDMSTNLHQFVGTHFLASYCGCEQNKMTDIETLKKVLDNAVEASGATVLGHVDHIFHGDINGYTSVYVLSESHASIHTYPETCACFVDLFTCGNHCSYKPFDQLLRAYLNPQMVNYHVLKRETVNTVIDSGHFI